MKVMSLNGDLVLVHDDQLEQGWDVFERDLLEMVAYRRDMGEKVKQPNMADAWNAWFDHDTWDFHGGTKDGRWEYEFFDVEELEPYLKMMGEH